MSIPLHMQSDLQLERDRKHEMSEMSRLRALLDHRDEWQQLWRAAYAAERSGGVVPVWSREVETDLDRAP